MDAVHVGRYLTVLNLMRYAQSAFEEVVHEHAKPTNRWIARLQGEPDVTVVGSMMIEGYRIAMQVLESSHTEADAFARLHAGIQAFQDDERVQTDRETRAARSALLKGQLIALLKLHQALVAVYGAHYSLGDDGEVRLVATLQQWDLLAA